MFMDGSSPLYLKRRRLTTFDEAESAKAKLEAVKAKFGREIRVFETSSHSTEANQVPGDDEADDFYEFTAEDYYRIMATKKEEKFLKTRKTQEAEEAARRSKFTKAVIKVRFPDNHTMEVTFHPSEKIQSLFDLLARVVARPDLSFYLYTTPPKKQIKDMSQDFYSAGFVPGAIVYFSYDPAEGDGSGPFLQEEIIGLKGLDVVSEQTQFLQPATKEGVQEAVASPAMDRQHNSHGPASKKPVKPKWLKL